jgi:hypothetical protein
MTDHPLPNDAHIAPVVVNIEFATARFDELGYPCELGLNLDLASGRFVSTDYNVGYSGRR